jgi:hypothetical protein
VIATINFILKPSNISWAVSVFLLSFFIYSYFFRKIKRAVAKQTLDPISNDRICVKNLTD